MKKQTMLSHAMTSSKMTNEQQQSAQDWFKAEMLQSASKADMYKRAVKDCPKGLLPQIDALWYQCKIEGKSKAVFSKKAGQLYPEKQRSANALFAIRFLESIY